MDEQSVSGNRVDGLPGRTCRTCGWWKHQTNYAAQDDTECIGCYYTSLAGSTVAVQTPSPEAMSDAALARMVREMRAIQQPGDMVRMQEQLRCLTEENWTLRNDSGPREWSAFGIGAVVGAAIAWVIRGLL